MSWAKPMYKPDAEAAELVSTLTKLHADLTNHNPPAYLRVPEQIERPRLRGSDLPLCPLRTAFDTVREEQRLQDTTFMSDFYTRVGSEFHAILQKWYGVSGIMYGKYKCPKCGTLYPKNSKPDDNRACFGPRYCKCTTPKQACEYSEMEPFGIKNTGGFKGHTDGIGFIGGKYVVLEFKTTSAKKIEQRRKYGADPKHVLQSTAYRRVLPEFMEIEESMWWNHMLVIYFDRGDPSNSVIIPVRYEPEKFQEQVRVWVLTQKRIRKKRYWKIHGKCRTSNDDRYCPYNSTCFAKDRDKAIDKLLPGYIRRMKHAKG